MRYANNPEAMQATEWFELEVPLQSLKLPEVDREYHIGDPQTRHLGSIQEAALRYVRGVTDDEIRRLSSRKTSKA